MALKHRDESLEDWRLVHENAPLNWLAPLE